jgi:hypothetical protein
MVEMEEILTKIDDADIPLREWEYYALCLMEGDDLGEAEFWVRQLHASWSDLQQSIAVDEFEFDECASFGEARRCYEVCRAALVQRGFIYSDMDM